MIDSGLASKSVKKLTDLGVTVVPAIQADGFHQSAIETLAKISKDNDKFLFFDVDLWFQLPIDELFDKFDENFLMCIIQTMDLSEFHTKTCKNMK